MRRVSRLFILTSCVVALAPLCWHAMSSVKSAAELNVIPPTLFPHQLTFSNYAALLERHPFIRYCVNSFTVSALTSLICISVAAMAAYRLARTQSRWRSAIRLGLLGVG